MLCRMSATPTGPRPSPLPSPPLWRSRDYLVSDALCEIRADKLVGKTSHYDFEQAMEYDLREYTMFVDIERDDDIVDDI